MPGAGVIVLVLLWRVTWFDGGSTTALSHGLVVGLAVGLALVAVLAVQMYLWRDQIALALAQGTDPRLPVGFTLGMALYVVGLLGSLVLAGHLPARWGMGSQPGMFALALVGGAFLPWLLMLWPVRDVAGRASKLGWEDKSKFLYTEKKPGGKPDKWVGMR